MAATDIGKVLAVSLEARTAKLEREMKRASEVGGREFDKIEKRSKLASQRLEQNMAKAGAAVRQSLSGLDKAFLGGLLAGGAGGLLAGVKDIAHGIAEIGDEAKRAGVSVEAFQEWKHVAEQSRIPVDAMTDALKELNIRADEFAVTGKGSAADAFARLGLTPAEVQQKLKDPSAFMLELIERTQRLGGTAAGIRVFDELFGGTGGERLVALLSQSRGEIEATIKQARDLGLVVSADLVNDAAELDRRFNIVANTVGTALKTAIVEAADALGRFLEQFQAFDQQTTEGLDRQLKEIGLKKLDLDNLIAGTQTRLDKDDTGLFGINRGALESQLVTARAEIEQLVEQERQILAVLDTRKTTATTTAPLAPAASAPPTSGAPARDGYGQILASVREFIAAQQIERQALGMTAEQAAALRYEHDMLNQAIRAGIALSPDQRAEIEQLARDMATAETATRSLSDAQDANAEASQFFREGLAGSFTDFITGASSAQDAVRGLTDQLVRALLQAALLGTGPLGGLNGGVGLFSGIKLAGGGQVRGPGTGTSDSIPAMLSDGEHVIRASEARKHRALLEAINAGRLGSVLPGSLASASASPTVNISAPITVNGGGGTVEQNADLANRMSRSLAETVRALAAKEIAVAMRPGGALNQRTR